MTATEIVKNRKLQAISSDVAMDISDVKYNLMAALEIAANQENRDERLISLLIQAAKKLPIYIDELNKYF